MVVPVGKTPPTTTTTTTTSTTTTTTTTESSTAPDDEDNEIEDTSTTSGPTTTTENDSDSQWIKVCGLNPDHRIECDKAEILYNPVQGFVGSRPPHSHDS